MIKNKTCLLAFLITVFTIQVFSLTGAAQTLPGKRDSIYSKILKEERIITVVLPDQYKPDSTNKYDVLYVLDGDDDNTKLAKDIQRFIEKMGDMPATIIVGVMNTDRNRDFLPTHTKDDKTSGGAPQFLNFFKDELIPYINKTYPSNGDNTIFGHSFGGVFVTYAMLTEPQLFKSYIAADPSYWWDKNVMIGMTAGKLSRLENQHKTFYISAREGTGLTDMRILPMDSLLKRAAPADLAWKVSIYADETHGSIKLKSMYDGLKFSYAGYRHGPIIFHPSNGIILKNKPITLWYFGDTVKVRYTIDNTEPTFTSAHIRSDNMLDGPAKITIRRFTNRDKYDQIVSGEFKAGSWLRPDKLPSKMKSGGFNYARYEGDWKQLPDFKTLKPVETGKTDSGFSINKLAGKNHLALIISGQLETKEDGYYLFGLESDGSCKVYLADRLIIDMSNLPDNDSHVRSYILPLKKGFYPLRAEYVQKSDDRKFDFEYVTPGNFQTKNSTSIPLTVQYGE